MKKYNALLLLLFAFGSVVYPKDPKELFSKQDYILFCEAMRLQSVVNNAVQQVTGKGPQEYDDPSPCGYRSKSGVFLTYGYNNIYLYTPWGRITLIEGDIEAIQRLARSLMSSDERVISDYSELPVIFTSAMPTDEWSDYRSRWKAMAETYKAANKAFKD